MTKQISLCCNEELLFNGSRDHFDAFQCSKCGRLAGTPTDVKIKIYELEVEGKKVKLMEAEGLCQWLIKTNKRLDEAEGGEWFLKGFVGAKNMTDLVRRIADEFNKLRKEIKSLKSR